MFPLLFTLPNWLSKILSFLRFLFTLFDWLFKAYSILLFLKRIRLRYTDYRMVAPRFDKLKQLSERFPQYKDSIHPEDSESQKVMRKINQLWTRCDQLLAPYCTLSEDNPFTETPEVLNDVVSEVDENLLSIESKLPLNDVQESYEAQELEQASSVFALAQEAQQFRPLNQPHLTAPINAPQDTQDMV